MVKVVDEEIKVEGVAPVNNFLTVTMRLRFGPSFHNLCDDEGE